MYLCHSSHIHHGCPHEWRSYTVILSNVTTLLLSINGNSPLRQWHSKLSTKSAAATAKTRRGEHASNFDLSLGRRCILVDAVGCACMKCAALDFCALRGVAQNTGKWASPFAPTNVYYPKSAPLLIRHSMRLSGF